MKIGFFTRRLDYTMGGANESLDLMASGLVRRGHDVTVLVFNPSKNNLPENPLYNVVNLQEQYVNSRFGVNIRTFEALRAHESEFDIYHIFRPICLPGAGLYRKIIGNTPVVGRLNSFHLFCTNTELMDDRCYKHCTTTKKFLHSSWGLPKRLLKFPIYLASTYVEPWLFNQLDAFFAISPTVKEIYTSIGIQGNLITVIPNFCNDQFVREKTLETSGERKKGHDRDDHELRLLYVGRLIGLKNLETVLKSLQIVGGDVKLDIVGDGDRRTKLESLVNKLEIENQVQFHGWIERKEIPEYFENADLSIHPARIPEPFGRSILESLQCGTPVLVSDRGAPAWIIGDAGQTFPPENASKLARILESILDEPEKLGRWSKECKERVEFFGVEKNIDKVVRNYREILNEC